MGVHDFVDFVQRNGQCLHDLCDESCGAMEAIIVLIPDIITIREILSWPLTEFSKFKYKHCTYSWDDWNFEELEGYEEFLHGDKKWWEQAIWKSPTLPNYHLVTFESETYATFVNLAIDPKAISTEYYTELFNNRNYGVPKTKTIAFDKIINSGPENLFEYDGLRLDEFTLPESYTTLKNEILSLFPDCLTYRVTNGSVVENGNLFAIPSEDLQKWIYCPRGGMIQLHHARFEALLYDHINSDNPLLKITRSISRMHLNLPDKSEEFKFKFFPNIKIELDYKLLDGCVQCGRRRVTGSYTCINHTYTPEDLVSHQRKINRKCNRLIRNLNLLRNIVIPDSLSCKFVEKNVEYNFVLNKI